MSPSSQVTSVRCLSAMHNDSAKYLTCVISHTAPPSTTPGGECCYYHHGTVKQLRIQEIKGHSQLQSFLGVPLLTSLCR